MGIMDRTFFTRFLRERDFHDIIKLGSKIHGEDYSLSVELLYNALRSDTQCCFTLSLNEGDGKEKIIGFVITKVIDDTAHIRYSALNGSFVGSGFEEDLINRSIAECKRAGVEEFKRYV